LHYPGYTGPKYRQAFLFGGPGGQNCDIWLYWQFYLIKP
jgi:hypothetical protein